MSQSVGHIKAPCTFSCTTYFILTINFQAMLLFTLSTHAVR